MSTADAEEVKGCCAELYGSEAVRWLLGDELHPGGAELTGRLLTALATGPGTLMVDVACGPGTSSLRAASMGGEVVGIDLSAISLDRARVRAAEAGLAGRASFVEADAERLPLDDEVADGVLCECALCTFPDKGAALAEMARVLRPGGRLALSDMTAGGGELPSSLRGSVGCAACVGDARSRDDLVALVTDAGLTVERVEEHDAELMALADRAHARLRLARSLGSSAPGALRGQIAEALALADEIRAAIGSDRLGYLSLIARRPAAGD